MANQPFSYGIPDGTYTGKPKTASCYEKDGRLILDIRFAVKDPQSGQWYKNEKGYDWEPLKRHWLTSADGAFNEATIRGLKEWAKGWEPRSFDDFYWFQLPDANGTPFGNLLAVGEVELNFTTDNNGSQNMWVHDPARPKGGNRSVYVPDGGNSDKAALKAKWGSKAKALFAATPKKVATPAAQPAQTAAKAPQGGQGAPAPVVAPSRPANAPSAAPAHPGASPKPWAEYPANPGGAFAYFCSRLGEAYEGAKHDAKWFEVMEKSLPGKDPDEYTPADIQTLMQAIHEATAK